MENIIPNIDNKLLQEKADEFALKGAIETIKDFYSGYNSPYKKAIEENLQQRGFDHAFDLPDVVASINDSLTKEIDKIANTAVAKTFVPLVTKFLTRAESEMKFSDILKEFISCTDFEYNEQEWDDYSVSIEKEDDSFLRLVISDGEEEYDVGFYHNKYNKDESEKKHYTIYSLPFSYKSQRERTMKISLDGGATLEIPFTKGVLENKFVSFVARLIMAETKIYFDVDDFDEDMFPHNHCHC